MNDYIEVRIDADPCTEDITDLLAAELADIGFESFVADSKGLTAYAPAKLYDKEAVKNALADFAIDCSLKVSDNFVEGRDWNAEWEKNYFRPIVIGKRVAIYSSFHTDVPEAEHRIVIDPKMAFGTGHHATTSQVIKAMLELDLRGKSVIDMGTGTGILAILAAQLGAAPVTGIEIDEFAYVNAVENVRLNGHPEIVLINGDASALADVPPCDVFIANINRNIITGDIDRYAKALKTGGTMLLSGFYVEDIPVVAAAAARHGLRETGYTDEERWVCLRLTKDA
ncbi:MAG: 50S ribosomal protein L11 methyltransferase [Bacteroidales bacterium]|nr:50S ribosomal protein L11 methyltransferase [Bacteroidales bacterium]